MNKIEKNPRDLSNIALFIDMENLVISALEIALPVDLNPIIVKLLEYGRISIRRGFGDLDMACRKDWFLRGQIRRMIQENLIQFEDIPYITRYKNTADMRLAVEALSTAYNYPEIDYFAIVSADRDYVPLIAKLRELGKRIIGIGPSPDTVNEIYIKSCDIFLYYSSMFPRLPGPPSQIPVQHEGAILEDYLALLRQSVAALVQKGAKPVGAAVAPLIRQFRPDFDPKLANLSSFGELVTVAEKMGIIDVAPSGCDFVINLTNKTGLSEEGSRPSFQSIWDESSKAKQAYKEFLEEKMKCSIPSAEIRKEFYDEALKALKQKEEAGEAIDLVLLSEEISKKANIAPYNTSIFKVMYALFRADAFIAEIGIQPYNPRIRAANVPIEKWDTLFIRNCLVVLKQERRSWPLLEGPLCEVFETSPDKIKELIAEIEDF